MKKTGKGLQKLGLNWRHLLVYQRKVCLTLLKRAFGCFEKIENGGSNEICFGSFQKSGSKTKLGF